MKSNTDNEKLGILLAMVKIAWSDNKLTKEETDLIREEAIDQGLDKKDIQILLDSLMNPPEIEAIVDCLPTKEGRKAAALSAYIMMFADKNISFSEMEAFKKLCESFDFSPSEVSEIKNFGETILEQVGSGNIESAMFLEKIL